MPRFVRDDADLFYEDHRSGYETAPYPLVLGHSFMCSTQMWAPIVPYLATTHRVINVDLRGHGRSGPAGPCTIEDLAGDVLAILDHLEIERAVLFGLSIGGMAAMRVAARHPDRVAGLVLINTDAAPEIRRKVLEYELLGTIVQLVPPKFLLPRITPKMFGASVIRDRPEVVAPWHELWANMDVASTVNILHALLGRGDARPLLASVRCPSIVIHGREDRAIPLDRCMEVARLLPRSSFQIVERAGHLATLEAPEAITSAISPFLAVLDESG